MLVGESVVANSQLCGQRRQPRVRCPQLKASNKGGGEEVRIDPANTAPVQSSIAHKFYDIGLGHHGRLVQPVVDMEGLLHTYDYAIDVWLLWPANVALAS